MNDSFIIGAYWGSRLESIHEISSKISQTLSLLTDIDEQFTSWYELGISRKQALEKKISLDIEAINTICRKAIKKRELDENGYAKYGFGIGLWSGHRDEEASTISFNVGHSFDPIINLNNCCVIGFPYEGKALERLLRKEKAKQILSLLVKIWSPDYAVLTSDALRDKLDIGNEVGWITYKQSIIGIPQFHYGIIYEKKDNEHWFFPLSNNYDNSLVNDLLLIRNII